MLRGVRKTVNEVSCEVNCVLPAGVSGGRTAVC